MRTDGSRVLRRASGCERRRALRTRTAPVLALGGLLLAPFVGLAGAAWWIAQGESRPWVVETSPVAEPSIPPLASTTLEGVGASAMRLVPSLPMPPAPPAARRRSIPRPPARVATPIDVEPAPPKRAAPRPSPPPSPALPPPPIGARMAGHWAPAPPDWTRDAFLQLRSARDLRPEPEASPPPRVTPASPEPDVITDVPTTNVPTVGPQPAAFSVRGFDAEPFQRKIVTYLLGVDPRHIRLANPGSDPAPSLAPIFEPAPVALPKPVAPGVGTVRPLPVLPEPVAEPVPAPVDQESVRVAGPVHAAAAAPVRSLAARGFAPRTRVAFRSSFGTGATQVPEPSSALLLAAGLASLAVRRRARR